MRIGEEHHLRRFGRVDPLVLGVRHDVAHGTESTREEVHRADLLGRFGIGVSERTVGLERGLHQRDADQSIAVVLARVVGERADTRLDGPQREQRSLLERANCDQRLELVPKRLVQLDPQAPARR
ncbi:hypothetical protein SK069_17295 [Patulibacter brassicae]|uniref:Uncharacterized protein n=1 Tax=Patulibacter brassicae TaxID=1705717 RepID=A0ABU4VND4_9ACTN|nr:hypothetical protein [Patulibacter brassicae]MDX8153357.1 hypothetical protein [Patulibacter brassicae]